MTAPDDSRSVPRAPLSEVVYARLRDEIMRGEFPDGTQLNQVDLAERFGVSRIPIREALRRLQAESLVTSTPYHPFVVRNVTPTQVLELVDIRATLEDFALANRDAPNTETIGKLREVNQGMTDGADGGAFLSLDREFHKLIAGHDTMVVELIDDVRDRIHKYMSLMAAAKPGRATAAKEHAKIVDALELGDMDLARRLMREHVMRSREFIVRRLLESFDPGDKR